jgi:hypothetical protein
MKLKKALVQQLVTEVIVTLIVREFCALRYIVNYDTDICSSIREDTWVIPLWGRGRAR